MVFWQSVAYLSNLLGYSYPFTVQEGCVRLYKTYIYIGILFMRITSKVVCLSVCLQTSLGPRTWHMVSYGTF